MGVIAAVSLIRNEADILPAWLVALANWADFAVLMDHGSTDGSRELLDAACRANGWHLIDIAEPAYWQERFTAQGAQIAFDRGAAWIMPVDADEFLRVSGRDDMARRLAGCHPAIAPAFGWVNAFPAGGADAYVAPRPGIVQKLALSAARWGYGWRHGFGNHQIQHGKFRSPVQRVGEIAHVPLRSMAQMARKKQQAAVAIEARGDGSAQEIRSRFVYSEDLVGHAQHFPLSPQSDRVRTVEDLIAAGWARQALGLNGMNLVSCQ